MIDVILEIGGDDVKRTSVLLQRLLEKNGYNIARMEVKKAPPRLYKYGMRCRPFDIACQPNGVVKHEEADKGSTGYWSYIWYKEKLTIDEEENYSLTFLGSESVDMQ